MYMWHAQGLPSFSFRQAACHPSILPACPVRCPVYAVGCMSCLQLVILGSVVSGLHSASVSGCIAWLLLLVRVAMYQRRGRSDVLFVSLYHARAVCAADQAARCARYHRCVLFVVCVCFGHNRYVCMCMLMSTNPTQHNSSTNQAVDLKPARVASPTSKAPPACMALTHSAVTTPVQPFISSGFGVVSFHSVCLSLPALRVLCPMRADFVLVLSSVSG